MPWGNEPRLEAATGLRLGKRTCQEDAILGDVPQGGGAGVLVLADGLGGHVSGAIASRLAVTTALEEITEHRDAVGKLGRDIPGLLRNAAEAANHAILAHVDSHSETTGMGSTLLIVIVDAGRLFWLSIGDSPLYLLRGDKIRQLNEVHSLAPQFDFLAQMGEMDPVEAANHPDRSCLTSALGCTPLRQIDCPEAPFELRMGDIVLAASDGVLTLREETIRDTCLAVPPSSAADLVDGLLHRVEVANDDAQDNLSLGVMRVLPAQLQAGAPVRKRRRGLRAWLGYPEGRAGSRIGRLPTTKRPIEDRLLRGASAAE